MPASTSVAAEMSKPELVITHVFDAPPRVDREG